MLASKKPILITWLSI